jgi:SNF2 family DNA or RNA helicase|tara:strand:+ start:3649 stop:4947 length:1299 start_codon:yes stop_codon:yes gene_type:complete
MKLYSHQEEGIKFLVEQERALLADEMGLGKTIQAIKAIQLTNSRTLVFCPNSVKKQWEKEINIWAPELKVSIPNGKDRANTYKTTDADIIIINYEKSWREIEKEKLKTLNYNCIILDEAQRIKNWKAQRSEAIKMLPDPTYKWALTGTPLENRVSDLTSILDFLGVLPSYYTGRKRIREEDLEDILWSHMLRRVFHDYNYMPPAVVNNYYVELRPYQKELYHKFLTQLKVYIREKEFNVTNALARMTRLRQLANSAQLIDNERTDSNKLRELIILIDERVSMDNKVVVFSEFKQMCYIIKNVLEKMKLKVAFIRGDRQCDVETEKAKFYKDHDVMLCTKSGEEGLNLQAAYEIINFELPYNPARVLQRIGRCRRIGQTNTVNVINLLGLNTIDERILNINYEKQEIFSRVIEPHNVGVTMNRELIRKIVGGI